MQIREFAFDKVKITEPVLVNAFEKEQQYLRSLEPDRLLAGFRETAGLPKRADRYPGGWENSELSGHTLGHYMVAMAQLYAATKAGDIKESLSYVLEELSTCQAGRGYLFTSGEEIFNRIEEGRLAWMPWYTMHKLMNGLLAVYRLAELPEALEIAKKLGRWICNRVLRWTDKQQRKALCIADGGMNDCLYEMYKVTGEPDYLEAAEKFDEPDLYLKLAEGKDILANKHANNTIPKLLGAINRYMALGESEAFYLEVAEAFFDTVEKNHTYITGGNGELEHFRAPGALGANRTQCNCETCSSYNMLKLAERLYAVTGKKRYMDYYERTFMNAILGSQNPEDGMTTFFQPMAPGYFKTFGTPYSNFWCCTGTGMESFTKLNRGVYHLTEGRLYVNRYIASELTAEEYGLQLTQKVAMESFEEVSLSLKADAPKRFTLCLRIPEWAGDGVRAEVNGVALQCQEEDGYFLLDRTWAEGDRVVLKLFPTVKVHPLPDMQNCVAATYGPFVLAAGLGKAEMTTERLNTKVVVPTKTVPVCDRIVLKDELKLTEWFAHCNDNFVKQEGALRFSLLGTDVDGELVFEPYYKKYDERYGVYFEYHDADNLPADLRAKLEEQKRIEEERRAAEEERLRQEAEAEEERRRQEAEEEAERQRLEAEAEAERLRLEEAEAERRRLEEEERKRLAEEERLRKEEEERQAAEAARLAEEERLRKEEEERQAAEAARLAEEERLRKEEEERQAAEAARLAEEERLRKEEEERQAAEAARLAEEERLRKEEEERQAAEAARLAEEERLRKEEEERQAAEAARLAEEERLRKEEEERQAAEAARLEEEERLRKEEEERQAAEAARLAEEERQIAEEAKRIAAQRVADAERAAELAEAKAREEEAKLKAAQSEAERAEAEAAAKKAQTEQAEAEAAAAKAQEEIEAAKAAKAENLARQAKANMEASKASKKAAKKKRKRYREFSVGKLLAWIVGVLAVMVLLYVFATPVSKGFFMGKDAVDTFLAEKLPKVADFLKVKGNGDAIPVFKATGKTLYLAEDAESFVKTTTWPQGYQASVVRLNGKQYICLEGNGLKTYYLNEIAENDSKHVYLETGTGKALYFWDYTFEQPEKLCPVAGEFNTSGVKQYVINTVGAKNAFHVLDATTLEEHKVLLQAETAAQILAVDAYVEEDKNIRINLTAGETPYSFLVPKKAGAVLPDGYKIGLNGVRYTVNEAGIRFEAYVVSADAYLGKLIGTLRYADQIYEVDRFDFYAYVGDTYESEGEAPVLEAVTLSEAQGEHMEVTGDRGENLLVPVCADVKRYEYDTKSFLTEKNGEIRYIRDGKTVSVKGVDVSGNQGTIAWDTVAASGAEYAMIRLGIRGDETDGKCKLDGNYSKNVQGALKAGLEVGVSFTSRATTVEEAKEEAQFVLKNMEDYDITWPVAVDTVEGIGAGETRASKLSAKDRTACVKAFLDEIAAAGYTPVLYTDARWSALKLDLGELSAYDMWYSSKGEPAEYPYHYTMWQYTDGTEIPGINEAADLNISFVDYGAAE